MGGLGIEKIILIMLVVLLLFGAKKIPEFGSSLGKGIRDFKRSVNDLQNEMQSGVDSPPPRELPAPAPQSDPIPAARPEQSRSEPKRLLP
jgi:sec-independent protein translocase protein TatA